MAEAPADLTIRVVEPDDWRSHRDLRLEMLLDAADAFWTQYADVADFDEQDWRGRIEVQHHLQARRGGDPVGSVGIWEDADGDPATATLVAMYVAPRARGRHVGERLVQAVLDEALARKKRRVVLEVTEGNEPAIRLYQRMGFELTGSRRPHPRRDDLDELGMEHRLTPVPATGRDVEG